MIYLPHLLINGCKASVGIVGESGYAVVCGDHFGEVPLGVGGKGEKHEG